MKDFIELLLVESETLLFRLKPTVLTVCLNAKNLFFIVVYESDVHIVMF